MMRAPLRAMRSPGMRSWLLVGSLILAAACDLNPQPHPTRASGNTGEGTPSGMFGGNTPPPETPVVITPNPDEPSTEPGGDGEMPFPEPSDPGRNGAGEGGAPTTMTTLAPGGAGTGGQGGGDTSPGGAAGSGGENSGDAGSGDAGSDGANSGTAGTLGAP